MYEVVTDRTQQPVISILEAELETIYHIGLTPNSVSVSCPMDGNAAMSAEHQRQQYDLLRQFLTSSEKGFFLEMRFSHDEFAFVDALTRWLARIPSIDLASFPDLSELVVREFRQGESIEMLPMTAIKSYSERWSKSLWQTIQAYKVMTRDLHENYQSALKEWSQAAKALD
ncbi:hypothetical protein [Litoribacillus peritrichatus]|uniref:Uncharacterized protein n=1 Tax=Litoribacillus peritrichatus TaxID=718191 RepID=A0ABP7MKQ3_9GAMM